ncbi:TniQ family protein [Neobacillus sp. YIM B06451]|uniref:TniQ family protein n=1 Tax=Neobacillus sp. YIM B06451 TaxID=3070994 RepID=UPI00292D7BFB|nr:TniQ family protein [Neobacillus sp. YIM B06451]
MIDSETLIKKIRPYPKETLSSYLFRISKSNLMDNLSWIIKTFNTQTNTQQLSQNTIDWIESEKLFAELSLFTGLEEEKLSCMTFSEKLKKWGIDWDDIYKCPWFIYRTVKCCPECLKLHPYVRIDWCLGQSVCCTEHQRYLIDRCTNCNRELNSKTVVQGLCLCGMELHRMESTEVRSLEVTEYQTYLKQFLYGEKNLKFNEWIKEAPVFFQAIEFFATWIPLITTKDYIPPIDGFKFDGSTHAKTRLKKTKSQYQSIVLYSLAYNLLKEWPETYYTLLEHTYLKSKNKFEMFYKRAVVKHIDTSMNSVSKEFTKFLQSKLLLLDMKHQMLRMDEAKSLVHRYKETINDQNFPTHQCFINKTKLILFKSHEIHTWSQTVKSLLTKEEVREIWQTSARATYSILVGNILEGIYNFNYGSVLAWGVPKNSLEAFQNQLQEKSISDIADKISLNEAFEWIGPDNANLILKGILNGSLKLMINESLGHSFVSRSQCYYFLENIFLKEAKKLGTISLRDLAFIFGVKRSDIHYWIETGRLQQVGLKINSVTFISFQHFYNCFLTTYQLSFRKKKTVKQILNLHRIKKIQAIYGPHTGDGKRLLFSRDTY